MEDPVCILYGDSASSFTTSDNDLLLSTFVEYSTDITVMIKSFLIHNMLVLAGQGALVLFSPEQSLEQ